jgi:hypothetical protein
VRANEWPEERKYESSDSRVTGGKSRVGMVFLKERLVLMAGPEVSPLPHFVPFSPV